MVMVATTFLATYWIIYLVIFILIIFLAKQIYKKTKSGFLVAAFCIAIFLFSIFDILYGNYVYFKNESMWHGYTVNKSIDNIVDPSQLSQFNTNNKNFDTNKFLSTLVKMYHSNNRTISNDLREKFKLPRDLDRYLQQYIMLGNQTSYGICGMSSLEIYDISTGELLGRSRKVYLKNVKYLPFFRSLLGINNTFWGHSRESYKGNNFKFVKEVFPNYKF